MDSFESSASEEEIKAIEQFLQSVATDVDGRIQEGVTDYGTLVLARLFARQPRFVERVQEAKISLDVPALAEFIIGANQSAHGPGSDYLLFSLLWPLATPERERCIAAINDELRKQLDLKCPVARILVDDEHFVRPEKYDAGKYPLLSDLHDRCDDYEDFELTCEELMQIRNELENYLSKEAAPRFEDKILFVQLVIRIALRQTFHFVAD